MNLGGIGWDWTVKIGSSPISGDAHLKPEKGRFSYSFEGSPETSSGQAGTGPGTCYFSYLNDSKC